MIPLDLSSTTQLLPTTSTTNNMLDESARALPSPLKAPADFGVACSQSTTSPSSSSASALHRTLRRRRPARRSRLGLSSSSVRRRRRTSLSASRGTPAALPQAVECSSNERCLAAADSAAEMECRHITAPLRSSPHAAVSTIPPDPRSWSRDDVWAWLREVSLAFNMSPVDCCKFPFNGKAVCLMSEAMFSLRVPRGGALLYRDFKTRLLRAVHAAGSVS